MQYTVQIEMRFALNVLLAWRAKLLRKLIKKTKTCVKVYWK